MGAAQIFRKEHSLARIHKGRVLPQACSGYVGKIVAQSLHSSTQPHSTSCRDSKPCWGALQGPDGRACAKTAELRVTSSKLALYSSLGSCPACAAMPGQRGFHAAEEYAAAASEDEMDAAVGSSDGDDAAADCALELGNVLYSEPEPAAGSAARASPLLLLFDLNGTLLQKEWTSKGRTIQLRPGVTPVTASFKRPMCAADKLMTLLLRSKRCIRLSAHCTQASVSVHTGVERLAELGQAYRYVPVAAAVPFISTASLPQARSL